MTFIDWFAGIGGFRKGMEKAGHTCKGWCEKDKYAIRSYKAIFGDTNEWFSNDIMGVRPEDIPKVECWGIGSPCQSFSQNGSREGLKGESGVIKEIFRLISGFKQEDRPEWLIFENVKGMLSSNDGLDFLWILFELEQRGYDTRWQVINSKHFGLPQNRERVYLVGHDRARGRREILPVIGTAFDNPIYTEEGLKIKEAVKEGYSVAHLGDSVNMSFLNSSTRRGRIGKGIAQCLITMRRQAVVVKKDDKLTLRMLTPREYFRLQGFSDEDYDKASSVNTEFQLYKQAGNSMAVNVVEAIGKRLCEFE